MVEAPRQALRGHLTTLWSHPATPLWVYLALIAAAELITALVSLQLGHSVHILLLSALAIHAALGRVSSQRRFILALMLAPLIRVLSLALPLARFPQLSWYPFVAVPLLLATWFTIRQLRLSRHELGLRVGHLPLQLCIGCLGLVLGVTEYYILAPRPQFEQPTMAALSLAGLNLLISTGFTEELIFRGVLQVEGRRTLGRWALVYISALFGILHIGYLSVLDVIFVTAVGVVFAYLAQWTGSIFGVVIAHGITNIMLFLVMPTIAHDPLLLADIPYGRWAFALCVLVTVGALMVVLSTMMRMRSFDDRQRVGLQIWYMRHTAGLDLHELSARSGLSVRKLSELEAGYYKLWPEERDRLAWALDVSPETIVAFETNPER